MAKMTTQNDWKCAGCGKITPDRVRACECPTACLYREGDDGHLDHNVKTEVEQYPRPCGIGRIADNNKVLMVFFERQPSDDEMRTVLDTLKEQQV